MAELKLFPDGQKEIGVFRGFQHGGLEFHANLLLPYQKDYQHKPMHGQFLLVQLSTKDEAVLGRIASFAAEGKLASSQGEAFSLRVVQEDVDVPEDVRKQYINYRVNIRVLGVLRSDRENERLQFSPSHRRLPHLGSKVAFPTPEVLREIAGLDSGDAVLGHLAFGEHVYAKRKDSIYKGENLQLTDYPIQVGFPMESLHARRSFIFARAGYGKSNLNKLLFSKLYGGDTPTVPMRAGKKTPVGTIIFDPDGEYFWPDAQGRPALCDVPELESEIVVFTDRKAPHPFYESFVSGEIRLDIRRLKPSDVVSIALDPERQQQQNVRKLRALPDDRWHKLVDLIDRDRQSARLDAIGELLEMDGSKNEIETTAARANMNTIVGMLHSKSSRLMDRLMGALRAGKICVIDLSLMRGSQSMILSGLVLRRIFDHNQNEFTKKHPKLMPVIAVVEEAQAVLNSRAGVSEPYVTWVKEGRKYGLGMIMITQQPGSIPVEILSQGDNWFVFHLLSSADLFALKKANAHFSDDLLTTLLNEPLKGHGLVWSSEGRRQYPISMRVLPFDKIYTMTDAERLKSKGNTYHMQMLSANEKLRTETTGPVSAPAQEVDAEPEDAPIVDAKAEIERRLLEFLEKDKTLMERIESEEGVPWSELMRFFTDRIGNELDDAGTFAYNLIVRKMSSMFGIYKWDLYTHKDGRRYVHHKPVQDE